MRFLRRLLHEERGSEDLFFALFLAGVFMLLVTVAGLFLVLRLFSPMMPS